jgi:hypothetical protein
MAERMWGIGGIKLKTENINTAEKKPLAVPLRSPQIPDRLTWDQTRTHH